jgi:hypothetical protein
LEERNRNAKNIEKTLSCRKLGCRRRSNSTKRIKKTLHPKSCRDQHVNAAQKLKTCVFKKTRKKIKLSYVTLLRRANGGRSIHEFNATKRWLTDAEEKVVSDYSLELAARGFPLSHKRLKEHVDEVVRARGGGSQIFPESGVGINWTSQFVECHHELQMHWSQRLDHSRSRAVNPITKEAFFKLFRETVEGNGEEDVIVSELIWGADETGFQEGIGGKERVIGPKIKSIQHQQRGGDRENITAIVGICADGTSIPPAIIFKGECFQTSWKQENPLHASSALISPGKHVLTLLQSGICTQRIR